MELFVVIVAVVLMLAVTLLSIKGGGSGQRRQQILEELNNAWGLAKGDESARRDCMVKLDALLGKSLQYAGIRGESVGERLKNAKNRFDRDLYNRIWEAHKLRNAVVHEQRRISEKEARTAADTFNSAIRKLI